MEESLSEAEGLGEMSVADFECCSSEYEDGANSTEAESNPFVDEVNTHED